MNTKRNNENVISKPIFQYGNVIGEVFVYRNEIQIHLRDSNKVIKADHEALDYIINNTPQLFISLGICTKYS